MYAVSSNIMGETKKDGSQNPLLLRGDESQRRKAFFLNQVANLF